jgi:DNA polymerase (family 10)
MELGVPLVVSTDAHATSDFERRRFGVWTARRAWLGPEDVLDARPLREFLAWSSARRGR